MAFVLKRGDLQGFIDLLRRDYEFVAPVERNGVIAFGSARFAGEIALYGHPDYSPKKYFVPFKEALLRFNSSRVSGSRVKEKFAVFGLRQYDLDAIAVLDMLFLDAPEDSYYRQRRNNNLIIGYHSDELNDHVFCTHFPPKKKVFDLMFYYDSEKFLIESGSEKGDTIVADRMFGRTSEKVKRSVSCAKVISDDRDLMKFFDSHVWQKYADKCIACGACTMVCPTCACFTVGDEIDVGLKSGFRQRTESSCLLRGFTRVAGNHVFREAVASRYKQRYLHKLQYFRERYGVSMCTGCGRCARACPAKICSMVDVVGELK